MRLALIPPIEHLDFTNRTDMQLMLPELLGDREYRDAYDEHLSNPNQYVILDNGAAEDQQPSFDELVTIVEDLYPQELAIPDVLREGGATVERACAFLSLHGEFFEDVPTRLGLVTQGRSAFDATVTVHAVMSHPRSHLIKVLYIPRLLVTAAHDPLVRIKLANHFKKAYPHLDIHLFGAAASYPREAMMAGMTKSIRSMDTSLPFGAAAWGESVRNGGVHGRPEGYFNTVFDSEQLALAEDNVNCYMEWVSDDR